MKRYYKPLIIVLIIAWLFAAFAVKRYYFPKPIPTSQQQDTSPGPQPKEISPPTPETKPEENSEQFPSGVVKDQGKTLPSEKGALSVPFLVQAPFENWDALHEEACEEASLIMVYHYLNDTKIDSAEDGEKQIIDLVNYQEENEYGVSITLEELNKIARDYYGLENGRIVKNFTIEDIKRELYSLKPVIIPAAGKVLPNPYFSNGGPNYHMLVIKGYDRESFITNDPGTKRGEGFRYKFGDLYNAIHNWNPDNILNGEKAYLVFD